MWRKRIASEIIRRPERRKRQGQHHERERRVAVSRVVKGRVVREETRIEQARSSLRFFREREAPPHIRVVGIETEVEIVEIGGPTQDDAGDAASDVAHIEAVRAGRPCHRRAPGAHAGR
jgi:hypothetical protein